MTINEVCSCGASIEIEVIGVDFDISAAYRLTEFRKEHSCPKRGMKVIKETK